MSLAKFNKTGGADWGINTENWEFTKALDLKDGETYPFRGVFITKDNGYGEGAVIISDELLVNAPSGFVPVAKEILASQDTIDLIKEGNEVFTVEHYASKKYKEKVNGKSVPKQCVRIVLN